MSATDQMRAMLDQLMGTQRDGADNERHKYKFTDSRVCKTFLLDCCPHDVLASTRMDIGECSNVHDLALRADYEAAAKNKEHGYELDALKHLQAFVADADRRTELAKRRLAETQEELSSEVTTKLDRVHDLTEQIGKKLAAAEKAGNDGEVELSMKLMEEVENLKKEKSGAESEYRNSMPASSYQQQKLRVCEVCSAYLGIHDNDRRLADHFGGKLHLGFITIREKLDELKELVEEKRKQGVFANLGRDEERRRDRRDRDFRRDDRRDRDRRRRSTSRDRRSRSKSPRRDRRDRDDRRDRRRSRSRSPSDRRRRDRSHRSRDDDYER